VSREPPETCAHPWAALVGVLFAAATASLAFAGDGGAPGNGNGNSEIRVLHLNLKHDPQNETDAFVDLCTASLSLRQGQIAAQGLIDRLGAPPVALAVTAAPARTARPTGRSRPRGRTRRASSHSPYG
jgi:hypothetical protein